MSDTKKISNPPPPMNQKPQPPPAPPTMYELMRVELDAGMNTIAALMGDVCSLEMQLESVQGVLSETIAELTERSSDLDVTRKTIAEQEALLLGWEVAGETIVMLCSQRGLPFKLMQDVKGAIPKPKAAL